MTALTDHHEHSERENVREAPEEAESRESAGGEPARGERGEERSGDEGDGSEARPRREDEGQQPDSQGEFGENATRERRPDADGAPGGSERSAPDEPAPSGPDAAEGAATGDVAEADGDPLDVWDDGLIARRTPEGGGENGAAALRGRAGAVNGLEYTGELAGRLEAMRELVGLSRTRLEADQLAEAVRVLEESDARRRLSGEHTVVALAGATGSGKSALFNSLAGVNISETGVRRPTTALPLACSWGEGCGPLLDRLGIPARLRRRPVQSPDAEALRGLVLVDLPDHDSAAPEHREQVDRVLELVDAVVWVVDPEKYADAMLHERYLRPMAGHAEVTFVVLNQVDRLPGESADLVLDDLRRLLDEDGVALSEHGEPGAAVFAVSAASGAGVGELRDCLGQFVQERGAAARRVAADLDTAAAGLRTVYEPGPGVGLSEGARDEFGALLADSVGALAAGQAAERAWRRGAGRACGNPWLRLWRWTRARRAPQAEESGPEQGEAEATARQRVEQAVRTLSDQASRGLPTPWAQAVREAAARGAEGLPQALDQLNEATSASTEPAGRPPKPGWWPLAVFAQVSMTLLQVGGALWLLAQICRLCPPNLGVPALLMGVGVLGGPCVEWICRMAARGPARRYGTEAERRLREAAAACGRARVLEPVAAELLRYREVREQYARAAGKVPSDAVPPARVGELSTTRR